MEAWKKVIYIPPRRFPKRARADLRDWLLKNWRTNGVRVPDDFDAWRLDRLYAAYFRLIEPLVMKEYPELFEQTLRKRYPELFEQTVRK